MATSLGSEAVPTRRLAAQQLLRHAFSSPSELVAWMGAVQAQDFGAAKWAVGLRLPEASITDEGVERALSAGSVVRTHALRGTWQLVAPADVRWLLALVGPREVAKNARRCRELDLDEATFRRSNAVLAKALADRDLTRGELGAALEREGISPEGQRLPYLLQRAELDALICGGPRRGKQLTWSLLDRLAPADRGTLRRDEALAELARRYFVSRGPAAVDDFIWWSGLTAPEARNGFDSARSALQAETYGGQTLWRAASAPRAAPSRAAYLLPAFDEYLIAYRNRDAVLEPEHAKRINAGGGMLGPCVVVDGRVVGAWRRVPGRKAVSIELDLFDAPTRRGREAIDLAEQRYRAFSRR